MSKFNSKTAIGELKRVACLGVGLVLGSQITKFVTQKGVSGADLLGLSGDASRYATPGIVTVAGILASSMSDNPMLKDVSLGITLAGGAGLVNQMMGRSVVALGDTEDQPLQLIPGIGDVMERDLPPVADMNAANEMSTSYNEVVQPGPDVEFEEEGVSGIDGDELL